MFDAAPGWKTQQEVLRAKHRLNKSRLMTTPLTLPQVVYTLNTVVTPQMLYPLQVAVMNRATLRQWDTDYRAIVAKVGGISKSLPRASYYLPVEMGGLGLRSIEDEVDRARVYSNLQAMNDVNHDRAFGCDYNDEWASTQCKVVAASIRRGEVSSTLSRSEKGTQQEATVDSCRALGVGLGRVQDHNTWYSRAQGDIECARRIGGQCEGGVLAYTDGGLDPGPSPKAGWGFVACHPGGGVLRGWGRLKGQQLNATAEAMALLQVLRQTPLKQDVIVHIDNLGVIQTWDHYTCDDVRARLCSRARAVWNRIYALKRHRQLQGSNTSVVWVHSHVDDEERRQRIPTRKGRAKKGKPAPVNSGALPAMRVCACGGDEHGHCIADHHAHAGNDAADALAERGKHLDEGHWVLDWDNEATSVQLGHTSSIAPRAAGQLGSTAGEEPFVLIENTGDVCQGSVVDSLKSAVVQRHLRDLNGGASKRGREWERAHRASWAPAASALKHASTRFRVRAWGNCLPTYEHEWRKVMADGDNLYKHMYGRCGPFDGTCKCCKAGVVDNMTHIFVDCAAGPMQQARQATDKQIRSIWKDVGLEVEWRHLDWTHHNPTQYGDQWEAWWGRLGRVPVEGVRAMCQLAPGRQMEVHAAANATAKAALAGAEQMWAVRNELVQYWEHEVGISENKQERSKADWRRAHAQRPRGRRGPSPKAVEDLAANTRRQRESLMHRTQVVREHGSDKGRELHLAWLRERRERARGSGVGVQASIARWIEGLTPDERAAWSNPVCTAHAPCDTVTGSHTSNTPKDLGMCTYGSCTNKGVRLAWGCKGPEGHLRCNECSRYSCMGSKSSCQCTGTKKQGHVGVHDTAATRQIKIDKMVHQYGLWQERRRRTPVRIWVHSHHGHPRQVGEVTHVIHRNADLRKSWWRAVADKTHPWHPVEEVYIKVGEEEVSVLLHKVTWGIATGKGDLESPVGSDEEGGGEKVDNEAGTDDRAYQGEGSHEGSWCTADTVVGTQHSTAGPGPATMTIWEGYTEAEVCWMFGSDTTVRSSHVAGPGATSEWDCFPHGSAAHTKERSLRCMYSLTPTGQGEGRGDGGGDAEGAHAFGSHCTRGNAVPHARRRVARKVAASKVPHTAVVHCHRAPIPACIAEQNTPDRGEVSDGEVSLEPPRRVLRSSTRRRRAARTGELMSQMSVISVELDEDDTQWSEVGMSTGTFAHLVQEQERAQNLQQGHGASRKAGDERSSRKMAAGSTRVQGTGSERAAVGVDGRTVVFDDGG